MVVDIVELETPVVVVVVTTDVVTTIWVVEDEVADEVRVEVDSVEMVDEADEAEVE